MSRKVNTVFLKNLKEISGFEIVPEGWGTATIQDLFEIGRGRVINQNEINSNPGIYPVYSSQSFNNGEMGRIDSFDFDGEYITWTTDGAYAGTIFHRVGKFSCTNVCGTLKANEKKVNAKFFQYHLSNISKKYVSYLGNPKLMNDVMANIAITVPSLPTQRKIAQILSTTDTVIEKTQAAIAKYKAIKQGMLHDLFTRGIDIKTGKLRPKQEDAPDLYKKSELGWIPKEWDETDLINCTELIKDGTHGTHKDILNGVPLLSAKDIEDGRVLIPENCRKISLSDYSQIHSNYEIIENDLLLTIVGTIGRSAIVKNKKQLFTFQRSVAIIRVQKSKLLPDYFYQFTNTDNFQNQLLRAMNASAQGGVYLGEISKMNISFPKDTNEQIEINHMLLSIDKKILIEQNYLQKLQQIKSGLMADLLSGKKLVTINEELEIQKGNN